MHRHHLRLSEVALIEEASVCRYLLFLVMLIMFV